ncbi:MAG: hypothetical protein KBD46_00960 [Candidatus Levybacteria bacterium]|nr:hypothetical protein [Candidatus Levybacteria bacterium]
MAQTHYGGLIWTNHVLERLLQRGISQANALTAFRNPDTTTPGKNPGSIEVVKYFGTSRVTLIGKENEKREWIIISAWVDPPLPGSPDDRKQRSYQQYKNASGWRKILLAIKRQIGF